MSIEKLEQFEKNMLKMADNAVGKTNKKKKNNNNNIIYTSFLETEDYILEQMIDSPHSPHSPSLENTRFLLFDKKLASMEEVPFFSYQNRVFYPIMDDLIDKKVVLLPDKTEEYGSEKKLVDDIKEFLFEYFEVPRFFEHFLPYLVLFYWVYDRFPFVPYVHFLGRTGTGKSTAMEVLGSICYKPIDASGAITIASIFRVASLWRGTLLLDEFNPGGDSYKEMLSLLKSGVSDKAVLRIEGEKKREIKAYLVKSPKIFTSEKPVLDAGLRSRIIEIKMELNKRRIPLYRQKRYLEKAGEIRNKLLLWRMRTLSGIDLSSIEYGFKELSSFQGRVQQVITPVYYMANDKAKKEILEFAKEQQDETLRERRESLDGQLFEIICENYKQGIEPSLQDISEIVNKETRFPITERKIASIVRKSLGFEIERRGTGQDKVSVVILDKREDKIKELCFYYGTILFSSNDGECGESGENAPLVVLDEFFGSGKKPS